MTEMSRRGPCLRNRVAAEIETAVVEFAVEQPTWGQVRVANELAKRGLEISPSGVRTVWQRHDMENMNKRLVASRPRWRRSVEDRSGRGVLELHRHEKEAHGEFESEHPGYCGAQDTFYVGTLKGVGRIYQQTFVDTYSKVAFAKLYQDKTAATVRRTS